MEAKTIEQSFIDWEAHVFGFGYGTGEDYTIPALKALFAAVGDERGTRCYDHEALAKAVTPTVAWLLINTLAKAGMLEYGSSPRYGWLTPEGEALQAFLAAMSNDRLIELSTEVGRDLDYVICAPDACNCGPRGYQEGVKCRNPFWK